jgi:DNA-binding FadR family transcriptional regulator
VSAREDWASIHGLSAVDSKITQPAAIRGLHRRLVETLGVAIATSVLLEGSKIVPEDLAEEHDVARTVVREVLKVLGAKGMVVARPRYGTHVTLRGQWNLLDPDVIRWRSMGNDASRQIEELLAVRSAIEPLAARQASACATPDHIARLRQAIVSMRAASLERNWDAFIESDVVFHRALLESSGNLVVSQFAEPIEAALRVLHRRNLVPEPLPVDVSESHEAIVDAIVGGDEAGAELASRRIVDMAGAERMESRIQELRWKDARW